MTNRWLEAGLRVPIIFALDYCISFLHVVGTSIVLSYLFRIIAILVCVCILVSSSEQLFRVYHISLFLLHLIAVLYLNIWATPLTFTDIVFGDNLFEYMLLPAFSASWIVYLFVNILYALSFGSVRPLVTACVLIPVVERHVYYRDEEVPLYTCIAFAILVYITLQTVYKIALNFFNLVMMQMHLVSMRFRMYGGFLLFILHWRRLQMQAVLSLFWFIVWNYQLIVFTIFIDEPFQFTFLLSCCAYTCNSFIKVLAFCHILQHLVKVLLKGVKNFVKDQHTFVDDAQNRPTGLRESIGFFFLSMYTNLTSVDASKRIILIELIILIIVSALMRSIFEIIEPYLLALNSGVVFHSRKRHAGLLFSCFTLILMLIYLAFKLYYLRERIPFSIPNIITIVQILCAVLLYFLYMYDVHSGQAWEALDDYVYFIKGACRTFEFILIIMILGYRVFDTTSKWTVFQIVMVLLHLYVNVYLSLKEGWQSLKMRQLVIKRLKVLPQASEECLEEYGDVCPICLDEMTSARITPCNHLFHLFCLKKWLNVQNKCPLCHGVILQDSS